MANDVNGARSRFPWRLIGWGGAALVLLLPLIAMQFTDEVNWTPIDFVFAGGLIAGAGLALELAVRASGNLAYRAGALAAIAGGFLLIWVNAAVGFLGDEGNPANLMFFGVLATALIGSILARSQPAGMARAMLATAIAQALVGVIALVGRLGSLYEIVMGTGLFVTIWLVSAALFRIAPQK